MKLADFDVDTTDGSRPIAGALQWLETLIESPVVPWSPAQREAAGVSLARARYLLESQVEATAEDGTHVDILRLPPPAAAFH